MMTKKAAEPTDEQIIDVADDFKSSYQHGGVTVDQFDYFGFARAIWTLATQQATQGAEPVGVVREMWEPATGKTSIIATLDKPVPAGAELYTAPPPTAEVEKKAARYDWLRALPLFGAWDVTRVRPNREWLIDSLRADELDAAVDAALQSDQSQPGKEGGGVPNDEYLLSLGLRPKE